MIDVATAISRESDAVRSAGGGRHGVDLRYTEADLSPKHQNYIAKSSSRHFVPNSKLKVAVTRHFLMNRQKHSFFHGNFNSSIQFKNSPPPTPLVIIFIK